MQIDDNCTAGPEPRYASSDFIDCFMAGDCMSQSGRDALGSNVESPTGPRTLKNNSAILKQLSCLIVGSQNESSGLQFVTGSNNPSSLESSIRGKGPQPATCNVDNVVKSMSSVCMQTRSGPPPQLEACSRSSLRFRLPFWAYLQRCGASQELSIHSGSGILAEMVDVQPGIIQKESQRP